MNTPLPHTYWCAPCVGILFILALFFSTHACAAPLALGEQSAYDLAGHLDILKDSSRTMDFYQVLKAAETEQTKKLSQIYSELYGCSGKGKGQGQGMGHRHRWGQQRNNNQ